MDFHNIENMKLLAEMAYEILAAVVDYNNSRSPDCKAIKIKTHHLGHLIQCPISWCNATKNAINCQTDYKQNTVEADGLNSNLFWMSNSYRTLIRFDPIKIPSLGI